MAHSLSVVSSGFDNGSRLLVKSKVWLVVPSHSPEELADTLSTHWYMELLTLQERAYPIKQEV